MGLLQTEQCQAVAAAITEAERRTDAELVTVLAAQADDYRYIALLWAAALALLTPGILWFTPLSPLQLLALQWILFLVLSLVLQWPPLRMRLVPRAVRFWRASNLARRQFLEQNLHHTEGAHGVLIFVAEAEHYVEILVDRGVAAVVQDAEWQSIVDVFTADLHAGRTREGFLRCIAAVGQLLAERLPATRDKDELPNHLVILE